jgi:hypothetical protein
MAQDKVPEHVVNYLKLHKKSKRILATTQLTHSKAYTSMAEEVLKDKEGNIDYELLERPEIQEKAAEHMANTYVDAANKYFGSKLKKGKEEDRFQTDMLMKAYAGVTKSELLDYLRTNKKDYTLDSHKEHMGELMKAVQKQLRTSAASHLKEEHIPDFVKHMGIEDLVDATKMRIQDVTILHDIYEQQGIVSPNMVEDTYRRIGIPAPLYLKQAEKGKVIKYRPKKEVEQLDKAA